MVVRLLNKDGMQKQIQSIIHNKENLFKIIEKLEKHAQTKSILQIKNVLKTTCSILYFKSSSV